MPRRLIRHARHRIARAADSALIAGALTPSPRARDVVESLSHADRMAGMAAIAAFYDRPEYLEPDGPFFTRLPRLEPTTRRRRSYGRGGEIIDMRWRSGFEPIWSDASAETRFLHLVSPDSPLTQTERAELVHALEITGIADATVGIGGRYGRVERNHTMYARWFRHRKGPRPCLVILHGFMGGYLDVEEYLWPIRRLFRSGIDVVLTVLPLHGPRSDLRRILKPPDFPAADPRSAVEGFRHMVHDHLSLFDFLLDGRVEQLGLAGMSLGGYSAALLSTVDPRIALTIFDMPLASIPEIAMRTGRLVGTDVERALQHRYLERTYRTISPLSRPSRLPDDRSLIVVGEADQVTGPTHAALLASHFGARTSYFSGSHIVPLGRGHAQRPMWDLLQRAGFTS